MTQQVNSIYANQNKKIEYTSLTTLTTPTQNVTKSDTLRTHTNTLLKQIFTIPHQKWPLKCMIEQTNIKNTRFHEIIFLKTINNVKFVKQKISMRKIFYHKTVK